MSPLVFVTDYYNDIYKSRFLCPNQRRLHLGFESRDSFTERINYYGTILRSLFQGFPTSAWCCPRITRLQGNVGPNINVGVRATQPPANPFSSFPQR